MRCSDIKSNSQSSDRWQNICETQENRNRGQGANLDNHFILPDRPWSLATKQLTIYMLEMYLRSVLQSYNSGGRDQAHGNFLNQIVERTGICDNEFPILKGLRPSAQSWHAEPTLGLRVRMPRITTWFRPARLKPALYDRAARGQNRVAVQSRWWNRPGVAVWRRQPRAEGLNAVGVSTWNGKWLRPCENPPSGGNEAIDFRRDTVRIRWYC